MQVSDLHELDQIRRVKQKKDRPKDRSLWHSIQYVRLNGCGTSTANELLTVVKIGGEPAQNSAVNPVRCLESS